MTFLSFPALFFFICLPLTASYSYAQQGQLSAEKTDNWEDEWTDDWGGSPLASPWKITHFIELAYGRFTEDNVVESSHSLSDLRGRVNVGYSHKWFEFNAKGDFLYDAVLKKALFQTRELNVAFSPFSNIDVKLGRQVLTWGTGDYVFLNDIFTKDWQSFFSGRDDEYLKAASDSVRITSYWQNFTLDFAWTPEFSADNYLTGERFSFYSPVAQANIAPAEFFVVDQTKDAQWSARLATTIQGVEYAFYGYKGAWTTPNGINEHGLPYFPKMNAWGASALTPLNSGIFKVEFSYYNSIEDKHGKKPNIPNSQIRTLVGYEQEVMKNLSLGLQYYVEKTQQYQAFSQADLFSNEQVDEFRQLATIRLRYSTLQQKLIYSLFAFYSPTDQDSYLKPSINYRYDDHLSFSAGGNIFSGSQPYTFFGQHQKNSNVWLRSRFSF